MTDVATLGIAVDSSAVKGAATDLDKFAASSKNAERAASATVEAMAKGKPGAKAFAEGFAAADAAQENWSKSANKVVDNLSSQFVRLNMTAKEWQAFQNVQKAGVQIGSDAANNITKMSDALYEMERAQTRTATSGNNLANTLTRRVVFGLIAQQARQAAGELFSLNAEMAKTTDVAARIGMSGGGIQGIATSAGFKGVDSDKLVDAMLKFNQQVDQAKNGVGDLAQLFRANNQVLGTTEQTFFKVADLVKNAQTDAQKFQILQEAGLPTSREFVRVMEQGSAAIKQQATEVTALTDAQLKQAQVLDDRWNEMWTKFAQYAKRAVLEAADGLSVLTDPFAHKGTLLGAGLSALGFSRPDDPRASQNEPAGPTGAAGRGIGSDTVASAQSAQTAATITAEEYKRTQAVQQRIEAMQFEAQLAAQTNEVGRQGIQIEQLKAELKRGTLTLAQQEMIITQQMITQQAQLLGAYQNSAAQRMMGQQQALQSAQLEAQMVNMSAQAQDRYRLQLQYTQAIQSDLVQKFGQAGAAAVQAGNRQAVAAQIAASAYKQLVASTNASAAAEIAAGRDVAGVQQEIIAAYRARMAAAEETAAGIITQYAVESSAATQAAKEISDAKELERRASQYKKEALEEEARAQRDAYDACMKAAAASRENAAAKEQEAAETRRANQAAAAFNYQAAYLPSGYTYTLNKDVWMGKDGRYSQFNPDGYQSTSPLGAMLARQGAERYGQGGYSTQPSGAGGMWFDTVPNAQGYEFQANSILGGGGNYQQIVDQMLSGSMQINQDTAGFLQRLTALVPESQQPGIIQQQLAKLWEQPQTVARDELIKQLNQQLEALSASTDSLNETMQGLLSPYYTQDPRELKLGYRTFAQGGVMTPWGEVPLHKYDGGGIATRPQLAMFGEGDGPEAYVPLQSGAIPVRIDAPKGGSESKQIFIDASVNVQGSVDSESLNEIKLSGYQQAQRMADIVRMN